MYKAVTELSKSSNEVKGITNELKTLAFDLEKLINSYKIQHWQVLVVL